jgi:hypothetical protein
MKKVILALGLALFLLPTVAGAASSPAMNVIGMGKVGTSNDSSCPGIAKGCLTATGTFRGKPIANGSFTLHFTVDWTKTTKSSTGGTCGTGGGSVELTAKNGDMLQLSETGKVCKGGKSAYPYSFNGSYSVNGGANKYSDVGVGNGKASWQFLPANRIRTFAVGAFRLDTRPPG